MDNEKKKILIFYAAIGLGHKSIAENIGYWLEQAGFEVKLMDAQKTQGGILANWGKKIYQWIMPKTPFLWDWFYNTEWFISLTLGFRTNVAGLNYGHILDEIILFQPDLVISTHTTASAVLSYLKEKKLFTKKFVIAFSDFHLHRYWLYENADMYLVNTNEQKDEMLTLGLNPQKIIICGITLKPKAVINIAETKNKYGVLPQDKVVLISSGSQGFGVDENLITDLLTPPNTKIIVLCGSNSVIYKYLVNKFSNPNVIILNYHQFMDELYAITDIFVSKAGALSVSEALSWRLPVLISHLLPGGETHNYNYLLEKGLVMPEPINVIDSILEELDTGAFKKSIDKNTTARNLFNNNELLVETVSQTIDLFQK